MSKKNSFFKVLILGAIFTITGYFVAFTFGKPILDSAKSSSHWPETQGIIEKSTVERGRKDGKTMYSSFVEYTYYVDNQKHTSSTVYFGDNYSSSSSKGAKEIVNRYPTEKHVTVYYNPKFHGEAVLEPGAKMSSYMVFGAGMVVFIIGILVLFSRIVKILLGLGIFGLLFAKKK